MSMSAPEPDVLLFEAPTAEEALEAVHTQVGPGAEIISAERARTGGIGGFFAREVVQLRVRKPGTKTAAGSVAGSAAGAQPSVQPMAQPTGQPSAQSSAQSQGLDALMANLLAAEEDDERSFAEVLRARLGGDLTTSNGQTPAMGQAASAMGQAAPVAQATPTNGDATAMGRAAAAHIPGAPSAAAPGSPAPHAAAPAPAAPESPSWPMASADPIASHATPGPAPSADLGGPEPSASHAEWSLTNLMRLGLPAGILETLRGLDPRDEAAWVAGLAHAITPLTRPLPGGAAAYVGPRAAKLARTMDIPVIAVGTEADPERPFAVAMQGGEAARSWLAWNRARRWLHVVIGGEGWRPLLFDEPLAVSWVGDENLCEAIRLSSELGLVLGFGLGSGRGAKARRAVPLEVALTIRDLLPRR